METWEQIYKFFKIFLWCTTIVTNFTFLAYSYLEIWTTVKNDPHPGHTLTLERMSLIDLNNGEQF